MSKHIEENIKAILFDHDDTLVGTIEAKWEQHKYVAKEHYGKNITDYELHEHWGKPLQKLVCLLYGTDDAETAMANNLSSHERFPKELFSFSIPTLRYLKSAGLLLGIVTATSRFSFEHDLDLHEIPRDILDYTQTEEDTPFHKPDSRVFQPAILWLASVHIEPHEVLYVGDGLHDMKAAVTAGFNFMGVETGLVTAEEFRAAGAVSIENVGHLGK